MAGVTKETTITTTVSHWTKFLVDRAKPYDPNADGTKSTQGRFMEKSVYLRATAILKKAGEYDMIKKNYEDLYGPVEEIADGAMATEVEDDKGIEAEEDPFFEEIEEG